MELLAFGKTGWGDELFYATLMTIAAANATSHLPDVKSKLTSSCVL